MRTFRNILTVVAIAFASAVVAQDQPQVIKLSQTEGQFTETELTLVAGTYVFEVTNESVDREVGLVVANVTEEGSAGEHIQAGYLSNTITKGQTASSQVVTLEPGTYKYFCPLNPTPEYTITVAE